MAQNVRKPNTMPPQQKLVLGILALALLGGFYYYFIIMDLEDQIDNLKIKYNNSQKELDAFKDFRGQDEITELNERYAKILLRIEENKKLVPNEEEVAQLLSSVESDAFEAGLAVQSKEQKAKERYDYYDVLPVRYQVEGSYLQLMRFVKLLNEPGKRLVSLSQFDLKRISPKDRRGPKEKQPSLGGAGVTGPSSALVATFTLKGFTYTGQLAPIKKK